MDTMASRLEVNFKKLLGKAQEIANGQESREWYFPKNVKLVILYGSETGTAQEVAEGIHRMAVRKNIITEVMPMNDISIDQLVLSKLVLFVAATTGQGDDPENMKFFFINLWKERNNKTLLHNVQFGVIGLGDSSYQKFNYSAKRLNNLLVYLGGRQLLKIGLGDDQHELGPDYVIDNWLSEYFSILNDLYPELIKNDNVMELLPAKYQIEFINNSMDREPLITSNDYNYKNPYQTVLTMNERKCASDHFQDVRLLEFDISSMNCTYHPGDVLMVQPENSLDNVNAFIELLELDANKRILVTPNDRHVKMPHWYMLQGGCTIRDTVKSYFDIQSIPKRYFFELMSFFTESELEKEKFTEFATAVGKEELYNYCNRPKRTILEVLADFPQIAAKIPFEYLFDLIPPIKPRPYSIASSQRTDINKVQILVAVVLYRTNLKSDRIGLCSNWLAHLDTGAKVFIWLKKGSLIFPKLSEGLKSRNVMMIGPGTGCAPFRSYINESSALNSDQNVLMVFGCRGINKDYFFKKEWSQLVDQGVLRLLPAFSRDQEEKEYVQTVIKRNSKEVWRYISDVNTDLFYAGNAKRIPIDVYEALLFVCEMEGKMSSEMAKVYFKKNIEKRYQTESWA